MQFIAVEDIGRIVAGVFADRAAHRRRTLEIASDRPTGEELAAGFASALGKPVRYERLADEALEEWVSSARWRSWSTTDPWPATPTFRRCARHPSFLTFARWLEKAALEPLRGGGGATAG